MTLSQRATMFSEGMGLQYLNSSVPVIRRQLPPHHPGKGFWIIDRGRFSVAVINLAGTVYMESASNPFDKVDEILNEL